MPDLTAHCVQDIAEASSTVDLVVQGDSGTGKSRLGALMPRPFVLLLEKQGMKTILGWNPKAVVIPLYQDDKQGSYTGKPAVGRTCTEIRDAETKMRIMDHAFQALEAGRPHPEGGLAIPSWRVVKGELAGFDFSKQVHVQSCVVDTCTEWQEVKLEQLLGKKPSTSRPEDVPDGTWTTLKNATVDLHRRLRDLPLSTLALCHVSEKELRGSLKAVLGYYGKTVHPVVPRLVDAVGWLVKQSTQEGVGYACVFEGASDVAITKWCSGLAAVEQVPRDPGKGGPQEWIQRILAGDIGRVMGLPERNLTLDEAVNPVKAEGTRQREAKEEARKKKEAKESREAGTLGSGRRARAK